jgi:hypothetical protein
MLPPKKFEIFYNSNNDSAEYKKPLNTTGKDIIDLQYYLVKISKKSSLTPIRNNRLVQVFCSKWKYLQVFFPTGSQCKKPAGVYTTKR